MPEELDLLTCCGRHLTATVTASRSPLASLPAMGDDLSVTDHEAALVAIGLVLAFMGGALGSRLLAAYRSMYGQQSALRLAIAGMRAARLRWLIWAVVIFAIGWLWIHGELI
jgi:hypothetical protein